jgi:hypothetical protein
LLPQGQDNMPRPLLYDIRHCLLPFQQFKDIITDMVTAPSYARAYGYLNIIRRTEPLCIASIAF